MLDRYGGLTDKNAARRASCIRPCARARTSWPRSAATSASARAPRIFLRFQLTELEEFDPKAGEEDTLTAERKRLLNGTQLMDAANQALGYLSGGEGTEGNDVETLLGRASQKLQRMAQIDDGLKASFEAVERARVEAAEATSQLSSYAAALEIDPSRLEAVEERLNRWSEIKRKYGATVEEVLASRDKIDAELERDRPSAGARLEARSRDRRAVGRLREVHARRSRRRRKERRQDPSREHSGRAARARHARHRVRDRARRGAPRPMGARMAATAFSFSSAPTRARASSRWERSPRAASSRA